MNMQGYNSSFDSAGGIYNQKYNNKELQETGFYDYGWRQYMPDLGRWFGMDQLSEKFHNASPYTYVMNNPISFFDPDGRDMEMPGWLQNMWDKTNSESYWTSNGAGGFNGGNVNGGGMSHDNFTSFYNFLSSGQTGNYTYFTGTASMSSSYNSSQGAYNGTMDLGVGHNITIKDNSSWDGAKDWADKSATTMEGMFQFVADQRSALYNRGYWMDNLGNQRSVRYAGRGNSLIGLRSDYVRTTAKFGKYAKGAGYVGYAISAGEIGYGAYQDGWSYGKNAQVATVEATTGIVVGAGVGAGATWLTGALAGAAGGSVAPGVGTAIGFIVGAVAGYYASDYAGELMENSYK